VVVKIYYTGFRARTTRYFVTAVPFFGGLLAKAKLGFKNIFLTFTYTFLIGTSTGHGLQFGFQFMI